MRVLLRSLSACLAAVAMVFLAVASVGCATSHDTAVDGGGILRKENAREPVHGQVGVFYGQGGPRE